MAGSRLEQRILTILTTAVISYIVMNYPGYEKLGLLPEWRRDDPYGCPSRRYNFLVYAAGKNLVHTKIPVATGCRAGRTTGQRTKRTNVWLKDQIR